jgi:hypothetical protein
LAATLAQRNLPRQSRRLAPLLARAKIDREQPAPARKKDATIIGIAKRQKVTSRSRSATCRKLSPNHPIRPLHPGDLMMTERRASRRYRLATESNAVDGVGALKVTSGNGE